MNLIHDLQSANRRARRGNASNWNGSFNITHKKIHDPIGEVMRKDFVTRWEEPGFRSSWMQGELKTRAAGYQKRFGSGTLRGARASSYVGERGPFSDGMPGVTWRTPRGSSKTASRAFSNRASLRYGGAALSGLIGINAAGNAYSALQNGRIGSALANGAFAVGAGITSYQLAMGEGLMHDHFNKAIGFVAGKSKRWAGALIRGKKNAEWGNRLLKAATWLKG